jgi:hypothetical protein
MENALHAARAVDDGQYEPGGVELTAAGRLLIAAAVVGTATAGWLAFLHYEPVRAPVALVHPKVSHSAPGGVNDAVIGVAASGISSSSVAPAESGLSRLALVTEALQRERESYGARAAAWRLVAETNRQQIAALSSQLQAVESKVVAMEKAAPGSRAPREAVPDVAASTRAVHAAIDAAKTTAQVDVASLPVENISGQSLNVTALGNGVVQLGAQKLAVGELLTPGETIVAVDPVSRSIVTNRRILNVTN